MKKNQDVIIYLIIIAKKQPNRMHHQDSFILGGAATPTATAYAAVNTAVIEASATPNPDPVRHDTQPIGKPSNKKPSKSTRPTDPFKLTEEVRDNKKKDTDATRRKDEKIAAARANLECMTFERDTSKQLELNTWTDGNEKAWRKLKRWVDMVDACNRTQKHKEELAVFVGCNIVWAPYFGQDETEEEAESTREAIREFEDACNQLRERKRWRDRRGLGRD